MSKPPTKVQILSQMAEITGLSRETIKDLMKKGWEFDKQTDSQRMAFFSPSSSRGR